MQNLRVAILGCGWIASQHATILASEPGIQVVAVGARTREKAAGFIAAHDLNAVPYENFTHLLEAARPDALYVALPPAAHDGQVEAAAARGVHLFLEKPIALHSARAQSQAEAIREAGVISQVGFHLRHGSAVRRLHDLIADGSAGRATLFQGSFQCNALHASWWRERNLSGGQVLEQVIHLYDLAIHLLGDPLTAWGQMANLCHDSVSGYTIEDTSIGMLRHARGALTTITGSNCAIPDEWNSRFTVVCERITAVFSDSNHAEFTHLLPDGLVRRETISGTGDPYAAETRDFIAAIRAGRSASTPIAHGVRSLETVLAIMKSADEEGYPIQLPTTVFPT